MRSKLFVPASRPELFIKAMRSQADSISFDLEDAVLAHRKDEARQNLKQFFASDDFKETQQTHPKIIIVRVNPLDSGMLDADLEHVCVHGVSLLNIPKLTTSEDVLTCVRKIETIEHNKDLDVGILANIETPDALANAASIARAHPKVKGLQLGLGDLFEPLAIERYESANVHHVMMTMRLGAGASGKFAYDTAFTNVADTEGFRAEALAARKLGYLGKTCIHPSQVALANEVFSPTESEIAWATKVLSSAEQNDANGAYMLDGKMIDAPFIERARRVLEQAGGVPDSVYQN